MPDPALLLAGSLREVGEVGENGSAGGVTAHHGVPSVDSTGSSQSVELDGQDVGVGSTGPPLA